MSCIFDIDYMVPWHLSNPVSEWDPPGGGVDIDNFENTLDPISFCCFSFFKFCNK